MFPSQSCGPQEYDLLFSCFSKLPFPFYVLSCFLVNLIRFFLNNFSIPDCWFSLVLSGIIFSLLLSPLLSVSNILFPVFLFPFNCYHFFLFLLFQPLSCFPPLLFYYFHPLVILIVSYLILTLSSLPFLILDRFNE